MFLQPLIPAEFFSTNLTGWWHLGILLLVLVHEVFSFIYLVGKLLTTSKTAQMLSVPLFNVHRQLFFAIELASTLVTLVLGSFLHWWIQVALLMCFVSSFCFCSFEVTISALEQLLQKNFVFLFLVTEHRLLVSKWLLTKVTLMSKFELWFWSIYKLKLH